MPKLTFPIAIENDASKITRADLMSHVTISFERGHGYLANIDTPEYFIQRLERGSVICILKEGQCDLILFSIKVTPERKEQLKSLVTEDIVMDTVIAVVPTRYVPEGEQVQVALLAPSRKWVCDLIGRRPDRSYDSFDWLGCRQE